MRNMPKKHLKGLKTNEIYANLFYKKEIYKFLFSYRSWNLGTYERFI